jgi:hypothetical protein
LALWRFESAHALVRFVERLQAEGRGEAPKVRRGRRQPPRP